MNIEKLFNTACKELDEDVRPNRIEGLQIIKGRAKQFQGNKVDIYGKHRKQIAQSYIVVTVNCDGKKYFSEILTNKKEAVRYAKAVAQSRKVYYPKGSIRSINGIAYCAVIRLSDIVKEI